MGYAFRSFNLYIMSFISLMLILNFSIRTNKKNTYESLLHKHLVKQAGDIFSRVSSIISVNFLIANWKSSIMVF